MIEDTSRPSKRSKTPKRSLALPKGLSALALVGKGLTKKQKELAQQLGFGSKRISGRTVWYYLKKEGVEASVFQERYSTAKSYKEKVQQFLGTFERVKSKGRTKTKIASGALGYHETQVRESAYAYRLKKIGTRKEKDARGRSIEVGGHAVISKTEYAKFDKHLTVTFTPAWSAAKIRRRYFRDFDRLDSQGKAVFRRGRRIDDTYYGNRQLNKYYLQRIFSGRKLDLSVTVGFLDGNAVHNNGLTALSYKDLVAILFSYGFDPLAPLRDTEYIDDVRKRMGEELGAVLDDSTKYKRRLSDYIAKYAREVREVAYSYVIGGIKPPLAEGTIGWRKWKKKRFSQFTYPSGLNTPLVETGMLANEISYRVDENKIEMSNSDIKHEERAGSRERRIKEKAKVALDKIERKQRKASKSQKAKIEAEERSIVAAIDTSSKRARKNIAKFDTAYDEIFGNDIGEDLFR